MTLGWEPSAPWHLVVTGLALLAAALLLGRGVVDGWLVFARRGPVRGLVLLLSLLAGLMLTVAAWNPVLTAPIDPSRLHLVVVADVSSSVLRADGGWPAVRERASRLLDSLVTALPPEMRAASTASIVTVRSGVTVARRSLPLADLSRALRTVEPGEFASGAGTNLGAGLQQARELIEAAQVQGSVLLVSDGHENEGTPDANVLTAAQRLARQGIPVHVLPVASGQPELAIAAANLPARVEAESLTYLRAVLANGRAGPVQAALATTQNGDAAAAPPPEQARLDAGAFGRVRQPIRFEGLGLQTVDLVLTPSDGAGEHRRRLFTHVTRPPRILSIGGDHRWIDVLPAGAARVEQIGPRDLTSPEQLKDVDAVVIGSVSADQLAPETGPVLDRAVREEGIGLLVLNGGHEGAPPDGPTILASYAETGIGALLPVVPGPRPFTQEAPARQVVIMIDASGSMGGWRLNKAKEIATYVIQHRLRPQDHLDVLVFTTGALHIVENLPMDEAGKRFAIDQVSRIQIGGGTDPSEALRLIAGRKLENCGLLFISDGEFGAVSARPECKTTAFAIDSPGIVPGSAIARLGDAIPVPQSFNPAAITLPYFEPEQRTRYFEPGEFVGAQTDALARPGGRPLIPALPVDGSAVSHAKPDAEVYAVRPRLTDPLLALRPAGRGYVGVFTGAVPTAWAGQAEAGRAVASWLDAIVPYAARDRYDFRLADRGDRIDLQIALLAQDGRIPAVQSVGARVEVAGKPPVGVALRQAADLVSTFVGTMRLPREQAAQTGILVLEEAGPDALRRPQRIPLVIPPAASLTETATSEAYSYGLNEPLLRRVAEVTGGVYDPPPDATPLAARPAAPPSTPFWPWLLTIGGSLYLAAIALQRLNL
ncbi:MAG: VWA domain-containing protein [Chloroflexi bacterium]|nr:VWA domain-containing protein [Chloroflexota bacterium]